MPDHLSPGYDTTYPPPRGPVLLLTCMDLRLLDDTVRFMQHDGLTNRYDHVILAGAALGALGPVGHEGWKTTFEEHVGIAYSLRKFTDVYILEHRHCGAYEKFAPNGVFGDTELEAEREKECHAGYARLLRDWFGTWAAAKHVELGVRGFLMNLRGGVELLDLDAVPPAKPVPPKKPKKKA